MPLDADDIALLYEAHATGLLAFFLRHTYEPETAVDMLAETFAVAFVDRDLFERQSMLGAFAWLCSLAVDRLAELDRESVVTRRARNQLGFQRRQLRGSEYELIEGLLTHDELRSQLTGLIDAVSPEQRQAVQLRIVDDRPYAEVAIELGVSEQTARAWVSRGLNEARAAMTLAAIMECS